jgi:hypothetical protein
MDVFLRLNDIQELLGSHIGDITSCVRCFRTSLLTLVSV